LYSFSRAVPVTFACVASISACKARRSGENQKPL
jgi:hypothetical protein